MGRGEFGGYLNLRAINQTIVPSHVGLFRLNLALFGPEFGLNLGLFWRQVPMIAGRSYSALSNRSLVPGRVWLLVGRSTLHSPPQRDSQGGYRRIACGCSWCCLAALPRSCCIGRLATTSTPRRASAKLDRIIRIAD